ncbi:hypothetical protein CMQ_5188 [Grosmannia clavigera kw1407]|uniref:Uncharacterized protein n=1 Tax=Grosmannia clavigera (strain kw1407 / UAMH 11150) TaxID=655863 RepID=F0XBU8_GROCL|nr:uncharacterized protein CMQ_5188 [Grosmannia clavigera kw1407]EFX04926.1 hypothetical protein CMQ_5188 [Grosmannia clavigera kw1407]
MSSSPCKESANLINQIYQIYELIQSIIKIIGDIQLLCGATVGRFVINGFRLSVVIIRFMINIVFLFLPFSSPFEKANVSKNSVKDTATSDVAKDMATGNAKGNTTPNTSEVVISQDTSKDPKESLGDAMPLLATGTDHTVKKKV